MLRLTLCTNAHKLQLSNRLGGITYQHGLLRFSQLRPFRPSTYAHFSTDDYSLADDGIANLKAGNGIPNFEARITNLETDVKDIKTALKNIKTDLKIVKADLEFVKTDQEYMRPLVIFVFVTIITSSASLFTWAWRTRLHS